MVRKYLVLCTLHHRLSPLEGQFWVCFLEKLSEWPEGWVVDSGTKRDSRLSWEATGHSGSRVDRALGHPCVTVFALSSSRDPRSSREGLECHSRIRLGSPRRWGRCSPNAEPRQSLLCANLTKSGPPSSDAREHRSDPLGAPQLLRPHALSVAILVRANILTEGIAKRGGQPRRARCSPRAQELSALPDLTPFLPTPSITASAIGCSGPTTDPNSNLGCVWGVSSGQVLLMVDQGS